MINALNIRIPIHVTFDVWVGDEKAMSRTGMKNF